MLLQRRHRAQHVGDVLLVALRRARRRHPGPRRALPRRRPGPGPWRCGPGRRLPGRLPAGPGRRACRRRARPAPARPALLRQRRTKLHARARDSLSKASAKVNKSSCAGRLGPAHRGQAVAAERRVQAGRLLVHERHGLAVGVRLAVGLAQVAQRAQVLRRSRALMTACRAACGAALHPCRRRARARQMPASLRAPAPQAHAARQA